MRPAYHVRLADSESLRVGQIAIAIAIRSFPGKRDRGRDQRARPLDVFAVWSLD